MSLQRTTVFARCPVGREKGCASDPKGGGSALTAEVLLAAYDLRMEKFFDAPNDALQKLERGELDALIFVGGAPVPAFEKLDTSFHFVRLPANPIWSKSTRRKKSTRVFTLGQAKSKPLPFRP